MKNGSKNKMRKPKKITCRRKFRATLSINTIVCLSKDVKWFFDEGILEAPSEAKVIAVFHPSYIAKDEKHPEVSEKELKEKGV
ncbi:MAG: hypothetical protein IKW03_05445 [Clostridia bacterium]|nr:hypothetical protein [Clostridia bacterium]